MKRGEAVVAEDLSTIAADEGVAILPGDVLVVRTGWWAKFLSDRDAAAWWREGFPGLSATALPWIHDHGVAAIASDTGVLEVSPDTVNDWETFTFMPFHAIALRDMGMPLGEIWNLEVLATACAELEQYNFLLVAAPLPFTGAVGSPLNPIAIL
jgi:kynurenine formamidase